MYQPQPQVSGLVAPHVADTPKYSTRVKMVFGGIIAVALILFFARNFILGTPVETHAAAMGELRQSVVASGRVIWPQRVDVAAELTGRVAQIPVAEGQQVIKGQLLIQLENSDERANLMLALAAVAQAEARVRQQRETTLPTARESMKQAQTDAQQMRNQLVRMRQLNSENFVSDTELETAAHNQDIADSKLQSARLQLATNETAGSEAAVVLTALTQARANAGLAQIKLEQDAVRAPAAGTLISRSVEQGDIVQAGKILMVLAAQGETQLAVQIDEKNLAKLALGQIALGSADAFSDLHFVADVIYINPGIDASRGSVEIKLRVKNPPDYLRQDMTVSVDIETATRRNTLIIPTAAVREATGNNPWVLVVRNKRAVKQPISIGLRGDDNVEVLTGVVAGDALILASLASIIPGQHLRPTKVTPQ